MGALRDPDHGIYPYPTSSSPLAGDAGEYGSTTGRPRRVGFFDAVATRYGCRVQGATEVALPLLDVLGYLNQIPVCVAYRIDGRRTVDFPVPRDLERAEPMYRTIPGWGCDLAGARSFADLPPAARNYVLEIERLLEVPVRYISVGPRREETIDRGA